MIYFSHTPKAKATIVADTPEMKRLADNTKIQSNVQYHAEFEANKSKFTAVTDDPESKRLAANTRTISNISYHGLVDIKEEQEKKRSHIDPNEAPSVPVVGEFLTFLRLVLQWLPLENQQSPVYVVNMQFSRQTDRC